MTCPFCFCVEYSESYLPPTFFNNKVFRYIRCNNCDLIHIDPFPQVDDYLLMYAPSYQNGINDTILRDPYKKLGGLRFSYGKQFDIIKEYTSEKRILDFGCGNANFLLNANHHHFECDGVEFNPAHVEILKKLIAERAFFTVEEFFTNDSLKYDIIRLSNVLEHMENPKEIINKLISKLSKGGLLLIEGPIETNFNIAHLVRRCYFNGRKLFNPKRIVNHPPTHLLFSNAKNQRNFLKNFPLNELHFEVTESEWPFPEKTGDIKGPSDLMKYYIAKVSIIFSHLFSMWGNTFIYVGKYNSDSKNL